MIRSLLGHVMLMIRGCQHPKTEAMHADAYVFDNGKSIAVFYARCTLCGATIIHTD